MDFKKFSQLIMIEQTLFGLPFAYLGVLFAGGGSVYDWFWVTVAFAAARTAGMSFNRVIDAEIDGANPRTKDRLVPKGEVNPRTVWLTAIVSSLILIGSAYMLNVLCLYLSFPAVAMLFTYSYFKHFSASSHFYLGFVEAAAPIGGYLAVTGAFNLAPLALGFVIMMWIAGLDIVYALQDMEFDEQRKLHSVPVKVGKKNALRLSVLCYLFAIIGLITAGMLATMPFPYWIAVAGVGMIFVYQQMIARRDDPAVGAKKFFKANLYIAPMLLVGTALGVFIT